MPNSLETIVRRGHEEIATVVDSERGMLKVRELNFARLIAEESFSQADAYKEAFQPSEDAKPESIASMACRVANKPAVVAEVERIRVRIREQEMSKDERLGVALNGDSVRQLVALELFAVVMSSRPRDSVWLKCVEMLGRQKHVDAWVGAASAIDESKAASINGAKDAGEARASVMAFVKKAIANRIGSTTIEATVEPE